VIGLDTNLLVRMFVEDDPGEARRARRLVSNSAERGLFISDLVLCELAWVLVFTYGFRKTELVRAMESLLAAERFQFEDASRFARALSACAEGRGGFADYLIREHAQEAGCDTVATFDKDIQNEPGFRAP
jgi:predicted nucleic-acid-binding protein